MVKSNELSIFKMFFYGTMGSILASAIVSLISVLFLFSGYTLIKKYNKKGTKPLRDLQREQYLGIALCVIGMIPWVRYLIAGFGLEAGGRIFDELL